jgi:hypothetical protein
MSDAISAHGTVISRQPNATGVYTDIAEVGDLTPPSMGRNSSEVSTHNDDIDSYISGILRRGEVTFPINLVFDNPTHDHLTGLYHSLINHQKDGWKITWPDGTEMIFIGWITNIAPHAPVDGAQTADITIRPSGPMTFAGVAVPPVA